MRLRNYAYLASASKAASGSSGSPVLTLPVTSGLLMYIDVNDSSTLWSNTARTTPAVVGGAVQGVTDKSANNNHWSAFDFASSPTLQVVGSNRVLRYLSNSYLNFTNNVNTIRTVFWVISESNPADAYRFMLGHSSQYNFHSGARHQCFDATYSTINLLRIDKTVGGFNTNRPTSLKVVSVTTSMDSSADKLSMDRSYARNWEGDVALLLLYSTVLSLAEIEATEDAVKTYFGV
jgi:hypothetical protein